MKYIVTVEREDEFTEPTEISTRRVRTLCAELLRRIDKDANGRSIVEFRLDELETILGIS